MEWVWTRVGVVGALVAGLTLSAGVAVYLAGPRRLQSRLLAALLGVLGVAVLAGSGLTYLTADPREAYAWQAVNTVFFISYLWIYPAFLSTLGTPLAQQIGRVRPVLYVIAVAAPLLWFVAPERFVRGVEPAAFAPWGAVPGPVYSIPLLAGVAVGLLGLVLALSAYRRAPRGSLRRAQARAYFGAFGALDGSLIGFFALLLLNRDWIEVLLIGHLAGIITFVVLLAYGVLKTQLFDIDLRIKWGLRRGVVAGAFALAFVLGSETVELLLPVDGTVPGLIAAITLALAVRPVERWAARLTDRIMPGVEATEVYVTVRKREVYKAAVEELVAGEESGERDRRVFERLRAQLGLSHDDARAVEKDVAAAKPDRAGIWGYQV